MIWIRIYITNIADEKCFLFPNGAGIVEQLEWDDHLGGGDSLVCARGALEERLLRIGLPLGVHCSGFPALSTIQPAQKKLLADPFFGGSLDLVLWIRIWIRIYLTVLSPDPGGWNLPKFTNKSGFLPFKKAFVTSYVCFLIYYLPILKTIFHEKIQLFKT